jgi:hypothetical protein
MFNTLLVIYVWLSILTLAAFFLTILQSAATIKRRYPDYRGEKPSTSALVFGIFKMIIVSFMPLFNLLVFWVLIFHTEEVIDKMIEKVMEGK